MASDPSTVLLEYVQQASGLMYVSDLRDPKHSAAILESVSRVPVSAHSAKAWSDLASYVIGDDLSFETGRQALDALLLHLMPRA